MLNLKTHQIQNLDGESPYVRSDDHVGPALQRRRHDPAVVTLRERDAGDHLLPIGDTGVNSAPRRAPH